MFRNELGERYKGPAVVEMLLIDITTLYCEL